MHLDYFGLPQEPFGMTPDPAYLYASRTHSDALASLTSAIADTRGFLALVADPGMGKTTVLYRLSEQLRDSTRVVHLSQTQCNSREFIEYVLSDLGVDVNGMGLVAMHCQLNEILFEELLAGKRFVLIVDEAQNLDDSVLETVRMLSNFETHNAKLIQIVLAGQPSLAERLAQPQLSQLRQRIGVVSRLEPFSTEETSQYIEHRLKVAGYRGDAIFDPDAVDEIARRSKGIPRAINNLCYNSMRVAQALGIRPVTRAAIIDAARRLEFNTSMVEAPRATPKPEAPPPAASPKPPADAQTGSGKSLAAAASSIPAPKVEKRSANSFLTYAPAAKTQASWRTRSAIAAIIVITGTLLLAILGRSESRRGVAGSGSLGATGQLTDRAGVVLSTAAYDADPQETENGQVLTVAAGHQQTLKDLSLRYVGRFDTDLATQIRSLNPELRDPDHLEVGQLIRIPLPAGAMRKANDTAESMPEPAGSLLARLAEFLHERK